ncbi:MAG: phage tail assembly chaperone [Thermohalobaculum sp.]|nr:phage tail assembly chaperone [Thermohalobaculum sp.]
MTAPAPAGRCAAATRPAGDRPARVEWPALMAAGLGMLRLAPDVFWSMTPVEFAAALEGAGLVRRAAAPSRRAVLELMARFPDRTEG